MSNAEESTEEARSGLLKLRPSDVLFNDGDRAQSLFIIQNGQMRLYKPKGKGFIEIAVLRAGEVIGEMAYFDADNGSKRSCSAQAMVSSEVIEISFSAFSKTMATLNPWFKTIINTLANRLRTTNARVKELESNNASVNYSTGKHNGYEFFKVNDIIKILGTLFLVFKSHGEFHGDDIALHRKTLKLYAQDIYHIIESKLDQMLLLLTQMNLVVTQKDDQGGENIIIMKDINRIRSLFIFFNTEKHLPEEKKLKVSARCLIFLEAIWKKMQSTPNHDSALSTVEISSLLDAWKAKRQGITVGDLADARDFGFVGEVMVGEGNHLSVEVNFNKLQKSLPHLQFQSALSELNKTQAGS